MAPRRTLVIRADGNAQIGWGHAMRQMALAQAWAAAGGTTHWATAGLPQGIIRLGNAAGVAWHALNDTIPGSPQDAMALLDVARQANAAWIVVDGYAFGDNYEAQLGAAPCPWIAVDDSHHAEHAGADIILRPGNEHIDDLENGSATAQILCGLKYALIRESIAAQRMAARAPDRSVPRIAIVAGGSDAKNLIGLAVEALRQLPRSERPQLDIVCGADIHGNESLHRHLRLDAFEATLHRDCHDVSSLLRAATLLITAGGSTVLEALCLGCPSIVVSVAANQRPICRQLGIQNAIEYCGDIEEVQLNSLARRISSLLRDPERRRRMSETAARLLDGNGARRLVRRLALGRIGLRPATAADRQNLFELRNDPLVVSASRSCCTVSWDEHCNWFETTFRDARVRLWVVEGSNAPFLGQVRLEPSGIDGEAVISIALTAAARGCNLGSLIIAAAIRTAAFSGPIRRVRAVIRDDNRASRSAFQRVGFCWQEDIGGGWGAYILERPNRLPGMPLSGHAAAAVSTRS